MLNHDENTCKRGTKNQSIALTCDELLGRHLPRRRGDLPHAEVGEADDEVGREELLELRPDRLPQLLRLLQARRDRLEGS